MDDFSDIWPEWCDLSRRLAYQVEFAHQVSPEALERVDPHVAKFMMLRHLAVRQRLAAEARGERFPGVFLRDLATDVKAVAALLSSGRHQDASA